MSRNNPIIEPAPLEFDHNGLPYSPRYNDVYHAFAGGLEQADHVFLKGNRLPERWRGQRKFVVLETGFGQGLNFLVTWKAWQEDPDACQTLHYLSVEKHPFQREDLAQLHAHYAPIASLAAELRSQWPELTPGFHRLEFAEGRVILTLALGDAMTMLPQFTASPDAIYLDGFSPQTNPELWSPQLLTEIGLLANPGTTLATWTTLKTIRESLERVGFTLERRRGFAHKRRMLTGRIPDTKSGVADIFLQVPPPSDAIVVGAGLAGSLISERLCARGWTVQLFERQAAPAMETSSNLTAVMLPMLSLDDNRTSRLNRACYLYALRTIARWKNEGHPVEGEVCGVLQIARDAEHEQKQREIIARCGFSESYVRFVEQPEASELAGLPTSGGGWWFGGGAWWHPPALCQAALDRCQNYTHGRIESHYSTEIATITRTETGWSVQNAAGQTLAEAPHLILASAHDLLRMPQTAHLPLFRFRGQVSHLKDANDPTISLKTVVCKEGYVSPAFRGRHCVGASFHRGGEAPLRESDHLANIARLHSMLPTYLPSAEDGPMEGKVGFRPVSPDKLPIVGEMYRPDATPQGRDLSGIERWTGLHVATGYGARGLVWSLLMAELLASQINGDPLPLEADLAAIVDPARFLLRKKEL